MLIAASPAAQSPAAQSPAAQSPAAQSQTVQSPAVQSPAAPPQQPGAIQHLASPQHLTSLSPEKLSDEKLFLLCKQFGANALMWKRKFIGLLPEVSRRRLYHRKRFSSIFEFAFLLGGVSAAQVTLAVNLDHCFEDKPVLRRFLTQGLVSINKLARIISVVTAENEEFWAKQVQLLSHRALETLVRDHRLAKKQTEENKVGPLFENAAVEGTWNGETNPATIGVANVSLEAANASGGASPAPYNTGNESVAANVSPNSDPLNVTTESDSGSNFASQRFSLQNNFDGAKIDYQNGFHKPQNGHQFLHVQKFQLDPNILKLQLSPLTITKLLELQNKGIDINKIILDLVAQRENEIAQTKEQLSATLPSAQNRYIPAQVKKVVAAEHGQKCSIKTCARPAAVLHHTQRYALVRNHDPNYIAPLCLEHHKIAHTIDLKFQKAQGKDKQKEIKTEALSGSKTHDS